MNLYKKIILFIVFIGYIFMMVAFKKISDWMVLVGLVEESYYMFAIFLMALIILTVVSISLILEKARKKKQSIIKGGIFFEEENELKNMDKSILRTHHIVTKNNYSLSELQAIDDFFDEDRFLIFAKGIFIILQNSWSDFNFETLKTIETEDLYEEHKSVLEEFKNEGQRNVIKDVSVHSASILNFEHTNNKEYLDVIINSSMLEYILDEEKQKVIKGDKDFKINVTYQMRFERKKGAKTKKDSHKRKQNIKLEHSDCPNCGAPLKPELYGWCEYCMGINKEEETWLLNSIEVYEK